MMKDQGFEALLVEAAEEVDRKNSHGRILLMKKTYDFFVEAGLAEEAIKDVMALTTHQVQLIKSA